MLSNRKQILDKLKGDIKSEVNQTKQYDLYENGTVVYYNPVTDQLCSDYTEENSNTGVTEGCLKWYIFNDNKDKSSVNMILDHNTSGNIEWISKEDYEQANTDGTTCNYDSCNDEGPITVTRRLEEDTKKWKENARLIKAQEIADITGASSENTIKWNVNKIYGTDDIETKSAWFNLNGTGTTYSETDGWRKNVLSLDGKGKYGWLYDNTESCLTTGCNREDNNEYPHYEDSSQKSVISGYWTNDFIIKNTTNVWAVNKNASLGNHHAFYNSYYGVRPVIKLRKSKIKYEVYENGTAIYYNPETGKICNDYTEDNSKTENKTGCMKWYIFNDNSHTASVNMILDHNTTATSSWVSLEDYIEAGGTEEEYGENGNNNKGPLTLNKELAKLNDESNWKLTPRLITADEIAQITGADKALQWNSKLPFGTTVGTQSSYFYLDGTGDDYTNWQTQIVNEQNKSKFSWLYDYTTGCTNYGCTINGNNTWGYWTSTGSYNSINRRWIVVNTGSIGTNYVNSVSRGIRPVITVPKSDIANMDDILVKVSDMVLPISTESDGSKWARVFYHNNKGGTVLFTDEEEAKRTSQTDKISALTHLNTFKNNDGQFEFILRYPNDTDKYNRWIQTSNPTEEKISNPTGSEKATGYTPVHIDDDSYSWGGLTLSTSTTQTYLDGSVGDNSWFYSIGNYTRWVNGIPAAYGLLPNGTANVVELWVRIDDYLNK